MLVVAAWLIGTELSAGFAGAAAAEVESVLLYLFACLRIDQDLSKRYPAVVAGVGVLVLVVVILGGWVRVGCARLLCGHEVAPSWSVPRGVSPPPGLPTLSTAVLSHSRVRVSTVSVPSTEIIYRESVDVVDAARANC